MLCHAGLIGDDADDVVQGLGTDMGMGDISMFFLCEGFRSWTGGAWWLLDQGTSGLNASLSMGGGPIRVYSRIEIVLAGSVALVGQRSVRYYRIVQIVSSFAIGVKHLGIARM